MDAIQFHSEISKKFDSHYNSSRFEERLAIWTGLIDKYLNKGDTVLDAGCGSGILSMYVASLGNTVVAFDGSEKMIELCNSKLRDHNGLNVHFSVRSLPLDTSSLRDKYDLIISSSVLEYVSDYDACINNFNIRLKDGGLLIISLPNRKSLYRKLEKLAYFVIKKPRYLGYVKNMMTISEFTPHMRSNGFEVTEVIQYSSNNFINNFFKLIFLPKEHRSTLFVAVCRKISNNISHEATDPKFQNG